MKILFDTNTPAPLHRYLKGYEVALAVELEWDGLQNGALLDAAEKAGFDVLVTCDQNLPYQQNFTDRKVAVVILSTNHWLRIRPEAARIATAVEFVQRGQVVRVEVTKR